MTIPADIAKFLIRIGVAQKIPAVRRLVGDGLPFLKYYSKRVLGSPNEELRATQRLVDLATRSGLIDLSLGAPPANPNITRLLGELDPDEGYPPVAGLPILRSTIASHLERRWGRTIDPEREILVTNGVSQAVGLVLDTFLDRGEKVALFDPSFFLYRLASEHRGARVRYIPTRVEEGWVRVEERALRTSLRGAKILFVNSPVNPSGGVFPSELLERITYWCRRFDVLIFSDEVYDSFHYLPRQAPVCTLPDADRRTIVANSFSKTYGLASHRVGYVFADRNLIQPMVVAKLATAPFVSGIGQRLAAKALDRILPLNHDEQYSRRRDQVMELLATTGLVDSVPGGAFYFWVPIDSICPSSVKFAEELLSEKQVLVFPGQTLGPSGRTHVRLSFAGDETALWEGLDRFVQFVGQSSLPFDRGFQQKSLGEASRPRRVA